MKSVLISTFLYFLLSLTAFTQRQIQIICEPNVEVYLDGEFSGLTTEELNGFTIINVRKGKHIIEVIKDGFYSQKETVFVKRKKVFLEIRPFIPKMIITQSDYEIEESTKTGNLKIQSLPLEINIIIPDLGINSDKTKDTWGAKNIPLGKYLAHFKSNTLGFIYEIEIVDSSLTHLYIDIDGNKIMQKFAAGNNKIVEIPPRDIIKKCGESIYFIVEDMPIFMPEKCNDSQEGNELIQDYIRHNITYPEIAVEKRIQGKVYITFVVDCNGLIVDAKIARGINLFLDKEALRVINSLPGFKPGMQRGKPVNVSYTVPVNFKL